MKIYDDKNNHDKNKESVVLVPIEQELASSYIEYAMSVITSRALPDIRDGLKIVHRRILYGMHTMGNTHCKPFKKSARVVGDVVGKYHPHGNEAVYEAITRMTQDFASRYPLISGQGNFGSIDGDKPAAMRYTGIRLSPLGEKVLQDLKFQTVDYELNYDDTEIVPVVMPSSIPYLLMNGTSGIAVGMATNIPPHNLGELLDACMAMLKHPDLSHEDLCSHVKGPDFPTGATICNRSALSEMYRTGKGRIVVRANVKLDRVKNVITMVDVPYLCDKDGLLQQLAQLVNDKIIDGIINIIDDSGRHGTCINIILRRGANIDVVLNKLYTHSKMQVLFHMNAVALHKGTPELFPLRRLIEGFLEHRTTVVYRRAEFLLSKYRNRLHYLQGLAFAISNIEEIVKDVKKHKNNRAAVEYLLSTSFSTDKLDPFFKDLYKEVQDPIFNLIEGSRCKFSHVQALAVMELKITSLTSLEMNRMIEEGRKLLDKMRFCMGILQDSEKRRDLILQELEEAKIKFADNRRTKIEDMETHFEDIDFIDDVSMIVTYTAGGYIKAQISSLYRTQRRGGIGRVSSQFKEHDFLQGAFVTSKKSLLLCVTDKGRIYGLNCYAIPEYSSSSKGRPMSTLVSLLPGENVTNILPYEDCKDKSIMFFTKNGTVIRVPVRSFANAPRKAGLKAIIMRDGDSLIRAIIVGKEDSVQIFSNSGKSNKFLASNVRSTGRGTHGVKGMRLNEGEGVVAAINFVEKENDLYVLSVADNGFGKLTLTRDFPTKNRGLIGIFAFSPKYQLVDSTVVTLEDDIMLFASDGNMTRINVNEIRITKRVAKGVKLIQLKGSAKIIKIERIISEDI